MQCVCFMTVSLSSLQVIRILKELKQKYPDKELDQLVELANYYALLHQQKSRAFYRVQVTHTDTHVPTCKHIKYRTEARCKGKGHNEDK